MKKRPGKKPKAKQRKLAEIKRKKIFKKPKPKPKMKPSKKEEEPEPICHKCTPYPTCFIDDEDEDHPKCVLCNYEPEDTKDLLEHITIQHPVKELECKKCRVKTHLPDSDYCDTCKWEVENQTEEEETHSDLDTPTPEPEPEESKEPGREVTYPRRCKFCGEDISHLNANRTICEEADCVRQQEYINKGGELPAETGKRGKTGITCPACNTEDAWRCGTRMIDGEEKQMYMCRGCKKKFLPGIGDAAMPVKRKYHRRQKTETEESEVDEKQTPDETFVQKIRDIVGYKIPADYQIVLLKKVMKDKEDEQPEKQPGE